MDDAVIIILTLIFTIFAAINQTKKKKLPGPVKEPDIWKEIFQGNVQTPSAVPREIIVQNKPVIKTPPFKPASPALQIETFEEEGIRNETVASILEKQSGKGEVFQEDTPILEDFSLRKAIIFAEIIKPKYF